MEDEAKREHAARALCRALMVPEDQWRQRLPVIDVVLEAGADLDRLAAAAS